jgi:hypothetical protein
MDDRGSNEKVVNQSEAELERVWIVATPEHSQVVWIVDFVRADDGSITRSVKKGLAEPVFVGNNDAVRVLHPGHMTGKASGDFLREVAGGICPEYFALQPTLRRLVDEMIQALAARDDIPF